MLRRITTSLAGRYTAVGDALLMALNEAKKQTGRHQTFILFTDADTSRGKTSASAAAEVVGEYGIPIFTIGIGSSQKNENEIIAGGLYHALDLALLENIAKRSKGRSYQVSNTDAMKQALQDILQQRKNTAVAKAQYEHRALYLYPLGLGLLMLVLWQIYGLALQVKNQTKPATDSSTDADLILTTQERLSNE
jgi:Ca-activated chloride channel family protein